MQSVFTFDAKARRKAIEDKLAAKSANFAKGTNVEVEDFSRFSKFSNPLIEESASVGSSPEVIMDKAQEIHAPEKPLELTQEQVVWQKKVDSIISKMKPENRTSFIRRANPGID